MIPPSLPVGPGLLSLVDSPMRRRVFLYRLREAGYAASYVSQIETDLEAMASEYTMQRREQNDQPRS